MNLKIEREKPPSEMKIALDNRAFEIQLFWQRSNYFLVLMTALGIATFSVKNIIFSPLVAIFTCLCSFLWYRTNLGSKFWQESWELEVVLLAKELNIRSFERPTSEAVANVRKEIFVDRDFKNKDFQKWIYSQILKKPSVTYHMIVLSFFATIFWAIVASIFSIELLDKILSYFDRCIICLPRLYSDAAPNLLLRLH